jgi:hypothetical protein
MATLLLFILEFHPKFQGTDTVDIDNIDVQKGSLNYNTVLNRSQRCYGSYWSFNGNFRVLIQWILTILTFNKAL